MSLTAEQLAEQLVREAAQHQVRTAREWQILANDFSARHGRPHFKKWELWAAYQALVQRGELAANRYLAQSLTKRRVRTLSGVVTVAVLTKPAPCPGNCLFCPTEKAMPKSYLSNEPAVMRAVLNQFNPYRQVQNRLYSLESTGHTVDKVELIVMGGTFSALPKRYQTSFIKGCFDGLNNYPQARALFGEVQTAAQLKHIHYRRGMAGVPRARDLRTAQTLNERAACRCVGLTLETRPDWVTPAEVRRMRWLGATRVEMGVQAVDDRILSLNRRGHDVAATVQATRLLKDAGFKITYHLMPGLYGSSLEQDVDMMRQIFNEARFQPDQIKLYPTVVVPHSDLAELYARGEYQPLSTADLIKFFVQIKRDIIPPYCRISRLIRDIPEESIVAGNKVTNLRQVISTELHRLGASCRCIRCREIQDLNYEPTTIQERVVRYAASEGEEYFLTFEDPGQDKLLALCRLRRPSGAAPLFPVLKDAWLIRELHSYGSVVSIGASDGSRAQHRGWGRKLLASAEALARQGGAQRLAVISGIGVREYYRKWGYREADGYMVKEL